MFYICFIIKNKYYEIFSCQTKLTWAEYKSSDLPLIEASNFGMEHRINSVHSRFDVYNPEVYVVSVDSKYNYGLDFKIYLRYKADDGLMFFKSISYGSSSLTNAPFSLLQSYLFLDEELLSHVINVVDKDEVYKINIADARYDRSTKNRNFFSSNTDIYTVAIEF